MGVHSWGAMMGLAQKVVVLGSSARVRSWVWVAVPTAYKGILSQSSMSGSRSPAWTTWLQASRGARVPACQPEVGGLVP